jgi:hypothetical protein
VVGPVRDEGVLVVSSGAGYKLPCSVRDVYGFFNYYNQQIQPMLHRLGQCHRALELATGGRAERAGAAGIRQPEEAAGKALLTGDWLKRTTVSHQVVSNMEEGFDW